MAEQLQNGAVLEVPSSSNNKDGVTDGDTSDDDLDSLTDLMPLRTDEITPENEETPPAATMPFLGDLTKKKTKPLLGELSFGANLT